MRFRQLVVIASLTLIGCIDPQHQLLQQFELALTNDRAFAAGDLQNAISKAAAAGDVMGAAFWKCLTPVTITPYPNNVGLATGIQDARIVMSCLPVQGLGVVP